jgi:hypothetical protein
MSNLPLSNVERQIGKNLESKVLKHPVYDNLMSKHLERPLLITALKDGMTESEDQSLQQETIVECG